MSVAEIQTNFKVIHKIEKSKQDHNGLTTIKMPRVIGLKVHSHYTRTQYSNFVFEEFKTQELCSCGGLTEQKTKVNKQSMMN